MLKQQQEVLLQQTNQFVVGIRSMELAYYSKVYSNLMTLCSLYSGFIITSWTNTDLTQFERNVGSRLAGGTFYVASVISISCAIYCLQQCILCTVYAFGLALRGPLGSMVHAVNGIVEEQPLIISAFFLMNIFFAISTIAFFWGTETKILAIITTLLMSVGMCFWYYYCSRIINRFRWAEDIVAWDDIRGVYLEEDRVFPSSSSVNSAEGFLNLKDVSFAKDNEYPWVRKYFILDKSRLYYYENDSAALTRRDRPQNFRPIELEGYEVQLCHEDSLSISLVPIESDDDRRIWEFRGDSSAEVSYWDLAFREAASEIKRI